MTLPSVEAQNLLWMFGGAVFGYIVKREVRIKNLELTQTDILEKLVELKRDVDGIALFIGTPRAIAMKQKQDEQKGKTDDKAV